MSNYSRYNRLILFKFERHSYFHKFGNKTGTGAKIRNEFKIAFSRHLPLHTPAILTPYLVEGEGGGSNFTPSQK